MNKPLTLVFIDDPGHGWMETPINLVPVHIRKQISPYSYTNQDRDTLYLEEDCDAPLVLTYLKGIGYTVNFEEFTVGDFDIYCQNMGLRRFGHSKI